MPRPKGRKNNATLLKEASIKQCLKLTHGALLADAPAVAAAMVKKAKEGDVSAAALIFKYTLMSPESKKALGQDKAAIQINIVSAEPHKEVEVIHGNHSKQSETESFPGLSADGESWEGSQGGEEFSEHGSEEGNQPH